MLKFVFVEVVVLVVVLVIVLEVVLTGEDFGETVLLVVVVVVVIRGFTEVVLANLVVEEDNDGAVFAFVGEELEELLFLIVEVFGFE